MYDQLYNGAEKECNDSEVVLVTQTGSKITSQYFLLKPDKWADKLKGLDPKDIGLTVSSIPGEDGADAQRGILCRLEEKDSCPKVHVLV